MLRKPGPRPMVVRRWGRGGGARDGDWGFVLLSGKENGQARCTRLATPRLSRDDLQEFQASLDYKGSSKLEATLGYRNPEKKKVL